MDPVTQGALGAVASLSIAKRPCVRLAALAGWAGGMLADADIFIRSDSDPLLNLEYHRHFTHSLIFIPIGGLVCAGLLWWFLRKRTSFLELYLYCTAGYATAGLLDACTSYGTQLLWPFSDARVAWNIISIIDPVFTITLLILISLAVIRKARHFARIAVLFSLGYLCLGWLQRERASELQQELASERGHVTIEQATMKPSIGNLILWRSIYRHEDQFFIDAVRAPFFGDPIIYPGSTIGAYDLPAALDRLPENSALANDLKRFDHFSDAYLGTLPDQPDFIADVRYAAVPNSIEPLWGIQIYPTTPSRHAEFITTRTFDKSKRDSFLKMLFGDPRPPAHP